MPSRDDHHEVSGTCKRCGQRDAVVKGRDSVQCAECFIFFIQTKAIKTLTSLAIRESSKGTLHKVLVPVSFGVCSTVLLHILDKHLERQRSKSGRVGYELHVLHVDDGSVAQQGHSPDDFLSRLEKRYPLHCYYLREPDAVDTGSAVFAHGESSLPDLMGSLPSATSKADVLALAVQKSIARTAESLGCTTILQGFSTTALAERLLSATAKGRGFALPYLSQDGPAPFSKADVKTIYPLREVLSKEVAAFARITAPPLTDVIVATELKAPVSSKNMTIDGLMRDYFAGVEQQYPAIVTNVVRTSERLERPNDCSRATCISCGTPMDASTEQWAGEQTLESPCEPSSELCYGCRRAFEGAKMPT